MPRFKLTVEYDGGPFFGFQRQKDGPSVQAELERALGAFAGHEVKVFAAGRTDTGVHATGQVVHVDIEKPLAADKIRDAANAHLRPHPIAVLEAEEVGAQFHARFDATKRHYLYRVLCRRSPPALKAGRVWWQPRRLDVMAMSQAAKGLLGHHDFTTFRAAQCQANSPVKTLDQADVRETDDEIKFQFAARSFLHSQVRSMVGSLVEVGLGRHAPSHMAQILKACDRSLCGALAPPQGLYLTQVDYEPSDDGAT